MAADPSQAGQDPGLNLDGLVGMGDGPDVNGSDPYDPGKVQDTINQVMASVLNQLKSGKDPAFSIMYLLYLMQAYGGQTIGRDGFNQQRMNKFISKVKDMWAQLNDANDPTKSQAQQAQILTNFLTDIKEIQGYVDSDPFFVKEHPEMKATIDHLSTTLQDLAGKDGDLGAIWKKADPSAWKGSGQGDPTDMKSMDSDLGQLQSEMTGGSSIMSSIAKVHVQNQKTEQDGFAGFIKMLQKILQYMIQVSRTN